MRAVYRGGREWYTVAGRYGGAWRDTCGAYIRRYICDMAGGRIFAGYYMADFTGVNGGFSKKVYKSTRQLLYFPVY